MVLQCPLLLLSTYHLHVHHQVIELFSNGFESSDDHRVESLAAGVVVKEKACLRLLSSEGRRREGEGVRGGGREGGREWRREGVRG